MTATSMNIYFVRTSIFIVTKHLCFPKSAFPIFKTISEVTREFLIKFFEQAFRKNVYQLQRVIAFNKVAVESVFRPWRAIYRK